MLYELLFASGAWEGVSFVDTFAVAELLVYLLVVFGPIERVICRAKNSILGIIVLDLEVEILTVHEFLMFFGEMSFGHGPAFALLLTVDALFKPVGDQGALA